MFELVLRLGADMVLDFMSADLWMLLSLMLLISGLCFGLEDFSGGASWSVAGFGSSALDSVLETVSWVSVFTLSLTEASLGTFSEAELGSKVALPFGAG